MFFVWTKNSSFFESHLLLYAHFAKLLMKQHTIFSMNAVLPRNLNLNLPYLTPQSAFLRFTNTYCNDVLLKNHILLLLKINVYNLRKYEKKSQNNLIRNVTKVKNIEKEIAGTKKICCIAKTRKNLKTS